MNNVLKKKILHVGCNTKPLPDEFRRDVWQEVRLDIDPDVKPDIIASMTDLHMINEGEFDAILSSHNIEHLYPHEVPGTLKEFCRVLKDGGSLYMMCPDMQTIAEKIARGFWENPMYKSAAGPICPIDSVYGYRPAMAAGNLFMAHKTGFTAFSMSKHLKEAGFSDITVRRKEYDIWTDAKKNSSIPLEKAKINIVEPDMNLITAMRDNIDKEPFMKQDWTLGKAEKVS